MPRLGKELATLKGTETAIRALALSADGRSLIAGSVDGAITVWNLDQEKEPRTLKGHEGSVRALAVSASGILASGSEDRTVKVWDLAQGKERLSLPHPGQVWALAFSPSGQTLVSGGLDPAVRMWDPVTGKTRGTLNGHPGAVTALATHPRGEYLISAGRDGSLLRWHRAVSELPQLPLFFRQDFLNRNIDEQFLRYVPADAPRQCRVEAEGLHISLPGAKAKRARTGFQTRFNLHGDFDVILSYELLQANRPAMGPAIGLRLTVTTNTPTKDLLILSRISNMQGNGYHCAKTTTDVEGKQQVSLEAFATEVRSGKLRLVRGDRPSPFSWPKKVSIGFGSYANVNWAKTSQLPSALSSIPAMRTALPWRSGSAISRSELSRRQERLRAWQATRPSRKPHRLNNPRLRPRILPRNLRLPQRRSNLLSGPRPTPGRPRGTSRRHGSPRQWSLACWSFAQSLSWVFGCA